MKIIDVEQGSPEWFAARMGNVSASRVADIIAKTKSGYSASRENYLTELVLERFGVKEESFTNAAMEWGTQQEPFARVAYEIKNDVLVQQVGYVVHNDIDRAGASPDGLVLDDGLLEIKCPNTKTHFEYLLNGKPPQKYITQMAWQMACTNRDYCDFVSFDPRAPEGLQYFEYRYFRDNDYIAMLESEVEDFLKEVETRFNLLNKKLEEMKGK